MGIEKFHLCGHSLGGYVATKYASSYKDNVLSLTLLSPAGMWPVPPNINEEFNTLLNKSGFLHSFLLKRVRNYWTFNRSPYQLLRNFGISSILFLKSYVKSYPRLEKGERKDLMRYLFQILMNRGTGELAMSYLLHPGAYGYDPLVTTLNAMTIPVKIFFGTRDWVYETKRSGISLVNPKVKEIIIKDASHQIQLDNSEDLVKEMLNDVLEKKKPPSFADLLLNGTKEVEEMLLRNPLIVL
eukprot:TRINITY_DN3003_c0_g1_i9.p1 TRINITY_DN3003_c0_g1~~TRINITY_DN3003_c0_g1_i9.p1  ORF type:complete len:241 (+),score=72.09 TRINITY_DN3003_c0_g1_i9:630-1352(+)